MNNFTLTQMITTFVAAYPIEYHTATRWQEPLVAYASAADPLFNDLKKIVSPTHALPIDFIEDAQSVITFFIPFDNEINRSNAGGRLSSHQWAVAYIETNRLIADLNQYIHTELGKIGFNSSNLPATHNFDETTLISDWSHKHVGYIAGLGKFGLHRMLITERGCSGRIGSIVTNLKLEPSSRPNEEYCLYYFNKTCRRCIANCTNGALRVDGFDRQRCYQSCLENAEFHQAAGLADVCGKCVTNVPCAFVNPVENIRKGI